jgi:hypothetical protein
MQIPIPVRATVPRLYKYSSLPSDKHLSRLRVIIQDHELYLPNLEQLASPLVCCVVSEHEKCRRVTRDQRQHRAAVMNLGAFQETSSENLIVMARALPAGTKENSAKAIVGLFLKAASAKPRSMPGPWLLRRQEL